MGTTVKPVQRRFISSGVDGLCPDTGLVCTTSMDLDVQDVCVASHLSFGIFGTLVKFVLSQNVRCPPQGWKCATSSSHQNLILYQSIMLNRKCCYTRLYKASLAIFSAAARAFIRSACSLFMASTPALTSALSLAACFLKSIDSSRVRC